MSTPVWILEDNAARVLGGLVARVLEVVMRSQYLHEIGTSIRKLQRIGERIHEHTRAKLEPFRDEEALAPSHETGQTRGRVVDVVVDQRSSSLFRTDQFCDPIEFLPREREFDSFPTDWHVRNHPEEVRLESQQHVQESTVHDLLVVHPALGQGEPPEQLRPPQVINSTHDPCVVAVPANTVVRRFIADDGQRDDNVTEQLQLSTELCRELDAIRVGIERDLWITPRDLQQTQSGLSSCEGDEPDAEVLLHLLQNDVEFVHVDEGRMFPRADAVVAVLAIEVAAVGDRYDVHFRGKAPVLTDLCSSQECILRVRHHQVGGSSFQCISQVCGTQVLSSHSQKEGQVLLGQSSCWSISHGLSPLDCGLVVELPYSL